MNKIIKQLNEIALEENWGTVDRIDGKPKAIVVIANAIAEITRLEKELEQTKKQSDTKPMTNRERLESLSDREFAEFMMGADTCACCIMDIKECECVENNIPCVTAKILWLRAEHEED